MSICKKRAGKVALTFAAILSAGFIYAYGAVNWGWWLPCLFNQITGLRCPGCGVSRMCLAILRLDFDRAFYWNPAVFLSLPILAYLLGSLSLRYIRYGDMKLRPRQQKLCWLLVAILLVFGVLRNLC